MSASFLHYAQAGLLSSITVLCLALTVVDALLIEFILRRTDFDDNAIYLIKRSAEGIVTRYWGYWQTATNRSYFALIVVGGVGMFLGLFALIALFGLRRVTFGLAFTGRKDPRPFHSAPIIILLIALLIPGLITSLVLSTIDNANKILDPVCQFGSLDYYNVTGFAFCTTWRPLTVEQWTCKMGYSMEKYGDIDVEHRAAVRQWCTNSRFAHWVTVPLLILSVFSILVALLQLREQNTHDKRPAWDPTFNRLTDSDDNSGDANAPSENSSHKSHSSQVSAIKNPSAEVMSPNASKVDDHQTEDATTSKGTTSPPVERGADRKKQSKPPMASGSATAASGKQAQVSYI